MEKPRLLDFFCCAGGAARGYADAGFEVIGCDIEPHKNYPYQCYQGNALEVADALLIGESWHGYRLGDFKAWHGSPECKGYTECNLSPHDLYERLIKPVRALFQRSGLLYVIENVRGATKELQANLMLCGSMFGLPMQRHRYFESNAWLYPPVCCDDRNTPIGVYGHSVWDSSKVGTPRKDGKRRPDSVPLAVGKEAMGIDWMNIEELAEALPPAYTKWIGTQLLSALAYNQASIDSEIVA